MTMRSWKPVIPRVLRGLMMQAIRVLRVRRGWGAGCSGLRNEFEVIEVEVGAFLS